MEPATKTATGEEPSQKPTGEEPLADEASTLEGKSDEELYEALEATEPGNRSQEPDDAVRYVEREAAEEPKPEPETEATEPAAEEEGEGEPEAEPKTEDESKAPTTPGAIKRLSVKGLSPEEQKSLADAVSMIRDGKAKTMQEAMTALGMVPRPAAEEASKPSGEQAEGSADQGTGDDAGESPPPATTAESIKTEIADLREQRRKAVEDYDAAEQARLTDEIEDRLLALSDAKQAEERASESARTYDQEFDRAVDRVEAKYPDAADESTKFYRFLDDRVAAMQARGDEGLKDPAFIEAVADQLAADLGVKAPVTPAPSRPARRPAGSELVPGSSSAPRPSEEDARRWLHEAPIEELEAAVFTE